MEPQKLTNESSLTQTSKSTAQSLLILKKAFSQSKKNYLEFDFLIPCDRVASQKWSVSEFLPVFNTDKKFYTPTFILKMDKPKYKIRDHVYHSLHQDRIQSNLNQETSKLRIPKPFHFNSHCLVCKIQFNDYLKHIESKYHIQKMHSSDFCHDIDQLCLRYGNVTKKGKIKSNIDKTKKIKKIQKEVNLKLIC